MKILVVVIKCLLLVAGVSSITIGHGQIPESDLPIFHEKSKRLIKNFTSSLEALTYVDQDKKERQCNAALERFVDGATIQVSSITTGNVTTYPIDIYVREKVAKYDDRYAVVVMEFEAVEIAKFKKLRTEGEETVYVAKYKFVQVFRGKRSLDDVEVNKEGLQIIEEWDYEDRTKKKGELVLKLNCGPAGCKWEVYLGDIEVESTESI